MNYFYAYIPDHKQQDAILQSVHLSEKQVYIDENREDWEKFSIQYPLEWVNIHAAGSFDSEIANDYNLFATPSMFLIDENHKIIAKPTTIGELEKNIGELE